MNMGPYSTDGSESYGYFVPFPGRQDWVGRCEFNPVLKAPGFNS
jgi:hypothetical protein